MLGEIKKLKSEIGKVNPDAFDLTYSLFALQENKLDKAEIASMMQGDFIAHASIGEHSLVENLSTLFNEFRRMKDMDIEINTDYLKRIYTIIKNEEFTEFRRSNLGIKELNYIPPRNYEIAELMDKLFIGVYKEGFDKEPILKGSYIHGRIMAICPFEDMNMEVAMAVLQYELFKVGYPFIVFSYSRDEYFEAISKYLYTNEIAPFYDAVERALYNKLITVKQEFISDSYPDS